MNVRLEIVKQLQKLTGEDHIQLSFSEREEHGDYTSNVAMVLAKNEGKNPREYAEELVKSISQVDSLKQFVSKIEIAGPGFINFFLSDEFLKENLNEIANAGNKYGTSNEGKGKTILVEYSSPNIAKRFSIGHFRATLIGQALRNLYDNLGYKTVGENHLGDWGTQFGMIMAALKRNSLDPQGLSVDELEKLYSEYTQEAKQDPQMRDDAKAWFKKLEEGDSEARNMWQITKDASLVEFDKIYKLLNVEIENNHGESFYEDKMAKVIEEFRNKGLSRKSEGAEIVEFEGMSPAMLLKSDGTTTYFTRDLAAIRYRIDTWDPQIFIYEVGAEQALHFRQVFEAAKLLGWAEGRQFIHIGHGLYLYEGKKMSTREGTTVKLEDLLQKSVDKAAELSKGDLDIAQKVGIGALKYLELSHHPTSKIDFSWKKAFQMDGNSGPYLQYTFARTQSVLSKGNSKSKQDNSCEDILYPEELTVMKCLIRFPQIVVQATNSYSPNLVCNYLYELAQKYNTFYNKHKIIGSQKEEFRLKLTKATGQVIKNGLNLLGIEAPEKM